MDTLDEHQIGVLFTYRYRKAMSTPVGIYTKTANQPAHKTTHTHTHTDTHTHTHTHTHTPFLNL